MRSQASSHKKPTNMVRIIKTPIRAISKALDLYVKGITNFSVTYNKPAMIMETTIESQQLPRSFSASRVYDNDQPVEGALVRSISTAAISSRANQMTVTNLELSVIQHHRHQLQSCASRKGVPRSCSVGMGRIDEDRVSSFRDESISVRNKLAMREDDSTFSRSRTSGLVSTKRSRLM
ncbi:hypothetical protein L6452_06031 [Arctium lappa]|uniref:Uncharacterized protein n=1 Tax=Arctium lappa TaxID=4217 RepID=A0ACB9EHF4_ARCLA|nr:hypothetical protein L6452_06031 [Arctium lappa]